MLGKKAIAVDDFIPLLVVMIIFVFALVFLLTLATINSKSNSQSSLYYVTSIELAVNMNQFLNKKVVCGNDEQKIIDYLATIKKDEDDKIKCLEAEVEKFDNKLKISFALDLELNEDKISLSDDSCSALKFNDGYGIELPHRRIMVCY